MSFIIVPRVFSPLVIPGSLVLNTKQVYAFTVPEFNTLTIKLWGGCGGGGGVSYGSYGNGGGAGENTIFDIFTANGGGGGYPSYQSGGYAVAGAGGTTSGNGDNNWDGISGSSNAGGYTADVLLYGGNGGAYNVGYNYGYGGGGGGGGKLIKTVSMGYYRPGQTINITVGGGGGSGYGSLSSGSSGDAGRVEISWA